MNDFQSVQKKKFFSPIACFGDLGWTRWTDLKIPAIYWGLSLPESSIWVFLGWTDFDFSKILGWTWVDEVDGFWEIFKNPSTLGYPRPP